MVECTELPLTLCSDFIQTVSLSYSSKITTSASNKAQSLIQQYEARSHEDSMLTYAEYAYRKYSTTSSSLTVLHFVGMNNTPCYPVSHSYARSTLILHSPWRDYLYHKMGDHDCILLFKSKVDSKQFPTSVILSFQQALNRHYCQISTAIEESNSSDDNELSEEDLLMLKSMTNLSTTECDHDSYIFNQGINFDWSKRHTVSVILVSCIR